MRAKLLVTLGLDDFTSDGRLSKETLSTVLVSHFHEISSQKSDLGILLF